MLLISACLIGENVRYDGRNNLRLNLKQMVEKGEAVVVCPEVLGGLAIPREPAEIVGGNGEDVLDGKCKVRTISGEDVTDAFLKGAYETLSIAKQHGVTKAILKEKSPSCGSNRIYNGEHNGIVINGFGITTALLRRNGIEVISEEEI
ncbi:MAG: DUF523 domain-containing protein [Bacillaceae bacterium]